MGDIIKSGECKNSPKNALVEDVAIDVFVGSGSWLQDRMAEDSVLELGDGTSVTGPGAIVHLLDKKLRGPFETLRITHAISHGRVGAANGSVVRKSNEVGFSVFVEFVNTKADRLKRLTLYGL